MRKLNKIFLVRCGESGLLHVLVDHVCWEQKQVSVLEKEITAVSHRDVVSVIVKLTLFYEFFCMFLSLCLVAYH